LLDLTKGCEVSHWIQFGTLIKFDNLRQPLFHMQRKQDQMGIFKFKSLLQESWET
jgi:hypothetical protein